MYDDSQLCDDDELIRDLWYKSRGGVNTLALIVVVHPEAQAPDSSISTSLAALHQEKLATNR